MFIFPLIKKSEGALLVFMSDPLKETPCNLMINNVSDCFHLNLQMKGTMQPSQPLLQRKTKDPKLTVKNG